MREKFDKNGILEFDNLKDAFIYYADNLLNSKKVISKNIKNIKTYRKELIELHPIFFKLKNPKKVIFNAKKYKCLPYWVISEILTEMNGLNPSIMNNYRSDIMEWSYDLLKSGRSCYQYGVRWMTHNSLEKTYERLLKNKTSKRCYIPIYDQTDVGDTPDSPCNLGFSILIRNNKLDLTLYTRSIDITKGFRYDFSLFSFIQQCLAKWLKVDLGNLYYCCNSLHCYGQDIKKLKEIRKNMSNANILQLDLDEDLEIRKTYDDLRKICDFEVLIRNKKDIDLNEFKKLNYKFSRDFVRIYCLKNYDDIDRKCFLNSMETKCKDWYDEVEK